MAKMDMPQFRCIHALQVTEHCDACMQGYFEALNMPVDEAAYRAMRQTAYKGPDPEFNAAVAELSSVPDTEAK